MEKYKTIHENKVLINPPDEVKRFKKCKYCGQVKGKHKLSCGTQKVVITIPANKG